MIDPGILQHVDFLQQRLRGHDDAIANIASDVITQNPRRNQVQYRLLSSYDERMTGIMASLEADHPLSMIC